jgi:hypothetical protein
MAGAVLSTNEFMETLPALNCPPKDRAVQKAYAAVWRYVNSRSPTDADFNSFAKTNPTPANFSACLACKWAACSLFLAPTGDYTALPKPRKKYKYIAKISITEQCGFTVESNNHFILAF